MCRKLHCKSSAVYNFNLIFYHLSHVDPTRPDPWVGSTVVQLCVNEPLLNDDQRRIYDAVCSAVDSAVGGMFFVDAPGGTGKTFLLNCILAYIRQRDHVALAVTGCGIAGLWPRYSSSGVPIEIQTIDITRSLGVPHSRDSSYPFISVDEDSTCGITPRSTTAELIRNTKLIVCDEAPMSHRHLFDALD